ncbi:hypothetical protein O3G_MSEX009506 [Manduca sexta]|uniref:Cuticle protein n=1 Tax=Manduca sexta TaxID=7130 RepID=A0A921ZE35_MANSE|nr:hypothetical protein O3G_MSEX009506 [Manduca sexta]
MKLIIFAALAALCSAEKLDRTYLPPASAKTAGGSAGSLQAPLVSGDELPAGGFVNEAQGVVVDAAAAGTRASPGVEETGLGGSRESYGSTASKVGDAAFRESAFSQIPNTFARIAPIPEHDTPIGPVFEGQVFKSKTLLPQASKDYNSNTLSYQNNVESHKYNYGFQTDNGIAVGEKGVAHDGIHAQGGYSYKGNDGQDYKVTYTADKGGYQPQGSHLPTPPPIPDDIIKSIEENAKEEAAGHYDDGSYDSQKYNAEGDYADSVKHDDKLSLFEKRPGSQASGVVINQNSQAGSAFPGFGSVSTDKPLAFSTYKPVYGSSQSGQSHGFGSFGSSSFGQSGQGVHTPSKTQFGQSSFGSQQTQFGSQFAQGSKPGFGFQTVKPQFGLNQPSQDSGILPSTPSSFTQFGSQSGQQSAQGLDIQQNKPLEGVFSKPGTNNFGSLTSNLGQTGSSNVAEKEYSPSVSNDSPVQGVDYQKPQIGIDSTPAFVSGVKPVGFVSQPQGSSATASASVTGFQTSLSGLSPQVLGGLQGPSKSQQGHKHLLTTH